MQEKPCTFISLLILPRLSQKSYQSINQDPILNSRSIIIQQLHKTSSESISHSSIYLLIHHNLPFHRSQLPPIKRPCASISIKHALNVPGGAITTSFRAALAKGLSVIAHLEYATPRNIARALVRHVGMLRGGLRGIGSRRRCLLVRPRAWGISCVHYKGICMAKACRGG